MDTHGGKSGTDNESRASHESEPAQTPSVEAQRARLVTAIGTASVVVALTLRLVFWGTTGRVWEDTLITVLHAENAAQGRGLIHHAGEGRVHGFTSPLSVLIPYLGELVISGSGILVLRLTSLTCAAVTIWFALQLARHAALSLSPAAAGFFFLYLAAEHHQILFGMAGMETQIVVCVLLGTIWSFLSGRPNLFGVFLALSLYSRPDAVIGVGVFLAAALVRDWRTGLRSAAWCIGLYVPWIVFTTFYYGSPVPHTVVAKSVGYARFFAEEPSRWPGALLYRLERLRPWLGPCWGGSGTRPMSILGPAVATALCQIALGVLVILGLSRVLRRRATRAMGVYLVGFFLYLLLVVGRAHNWYLVPFMAVAALVAAQGLDALGERFPVKCRLAVSGTLAFLLVLGYLWVLPTTFRNEALLQEVVEEGVRQRVGVWLAEHVPEDEPIVSESLGYVGYYSRRKILDFPGLASPASVEALRSLPEGRRTLEGLIDKLQPRWAVVRPLELDKLQHDYAATAGRYEIAEQFRVPGPEDAPGIPDAQLRGRTQAFHRGMWDGTLWTIDDRFLVLKRTR